MQNTIIKIMDADLNADGHWLLDTIRHQNRHLAAILSPRDGIIYAEINDEDTDDIVRVRVEDTLSYSQRARTYGIAGLQLTPDRWSGQFSEFGGNPIPTEAWATTLEQMYNNPHRTRRWYVPEHLLKRAHQRPDEGADIINAAALELRQWMQAATVALWYDPDWIGLTEAAAFVGEPLKTIQNATRDGRLHTWTDPQEPNPRRRTRVRRSEVEQRWAVVAAEGGRGRGEGLLDTVPIDRTEDRDRTAS